MCLLQDNRYLTTHVCTHSYWGTGFDSTIPRYPACMRKYRYLLLVRRAYESCTSHIGNCCSCQFSLLNVIFKSSKWTVEITSQIDKQTGRHSLWTHRTVSKSLVSFSLLKTVGNRGKDTTEWCCLTNLKQILLAPHYVFFARRTQNIWFHISWITFSVISKMLYSLCFSNTLSRTHRTLGISLSFPLVFKCLILDLVLTSQVWTGL